MEKRIVHKENSIVQQVLEDKHVYTSIFRLARIKKLPKNVKSNLRCVIIS